MSLTKNLRNAGLIGLMLTSGFVNAASMPFTGVFRGQGRGCWGKLYVRERTIEWNTPYSVCRKTPYTVIQSVLNSKSPHIAFSLNQKSKACRYKLIELSFDPKYPAYWQASGYQSREDFDNKNAPTEEAKLRTLSCSVQKID